MDAKAHWETVYETKAADEVSWYQPSAARSLALIREVAPDHDSPILDVGAGASVLVDELVDAGYTDVSVLDIAGPALEVARIRLGRAAQQVRWIEADVLSVALPEAGYAVWHDRAVFHFLTTPDEREAYVSQVRRAVRPGGYVLVATFAGDGPARCSGLDVRRYSPSSLHAEFGDAFRLLLDQREEHHAPSGAPQAFIYCLCRLEDASVPHA